MNIPLLVIAAHFACAVTGFAQATAEPKPASPKPSPAAPPKPAASIPPPQPEAAPAVETPVAAEPEERRRPPLITTDIGGRDLLFLTQALEQGLMQLHLSELAKERGEAEQVKAVADLLETTQVEENKRLVRLAAMKGINLNAEQPAGKKMIDAKLEKLSGPKFDKTVLEEIVNLNQRNVATYEAATNTQDDDIRAFAEQGLPLAKEKLLIASKMSGSPTRTSKTPGFRTAPGAQ